MKDKAFGARLKHLRNLRALTQVDAARAIGISYKALQDHESGSWPNRNNQRKYLDYYKCDEKWFLTGIGQPYINGERGPTVRSEILEDNGLWGHTSKKTINGKVFEITEFGPKKSQQNQPAKKEGLGNAVEKLVRILNSGDQVLVRAIVSNLDAFTRAIDSRDMAATRIEKLEAECLDLRTRLEALEERLETHRETNHKKGECA